MSLLGDLEIFNDSIESILSCEKTVDYKSTLQELAQEKGAVTPQYELVRDFGPDHDKTFEVSLTLLGIASKGLGKTKKAAEQDCAQNALKMMEATDV